MKNKRGIKNSFLSNELNLLITNIDMKSKIEKAINAKG